MSFLDILGGLVNVSGGGIAGLIADRIADGILDSIVSGLGSSR